MSSPTNQQPNNNSQRPLRPIPSSTNWTEVFVRIGAGIVAVALFAIAMNM